MGPLTGLRILEFAGIGPAPFCAKLLADLGAEIVRIERPGAGGDASLPDDSILHSGFARRSIDLKSDEGRAEALELIAGAHGLIEGFRPGVMERLELGPADVAHRSPALVYGRITGWGQTGPRAHQAGHDLNYISVTGALAAIGQPERPAIPLNLIGDYGGALYLALGMVAGLLAARTTGRGCVVDAAMVDAAAGLMTIFHGLQATGAWRGGREANLLDGGAPFYACYETADGRFMALAALEQRFYQVFLDRSGLHADPTLPDRADPGAWPELRRRIAACFRSKDQAAWVDIFADTDACVTPVLTLEEARHDPHAVSRGAYGGQAGFQAPAPCPRIGPLPAATWSA